MKKFFRVCFVISMMLLVSVTILPITNVSADWWDSDWDYYRTLEIADKIEGYQMRIIIEYENNTDDSANISCFGKCQADFDDIRFVHDNTTELDYWLENKTDSKSAVFWVENTGNNTSIEMFYGNDGANSNSNGANTFVHFENFEWGNNNDDITDSGGSVTWSERAGNGIISTDQSFGGTRSFEATGGSCYANFPCNTATNYAIRYSVYKQDADWVRLHCADGSQHWPTVRLDTTEDIDYYDTAYHDTGSNCKAGEWEHFEIRDYDTTDNDYDLWYGDNNVVYSKIGTDLAMRTNSGSLSNKIEIACSSDSTYFDNVFVRLWHDNNPYWDAYGVEVQKDLPEWDSGTYDLIWKVVNTDDDEILRLADNGTLSLMNCLGVGVSKPQYQLDVDGDICGDIIFVDDILQLKGKATAPVVTEVEGMIYYNSANNTAYGWDGSSWNALW